jgi:hypothetical protein
MAAEPVIEPDYLALPAHVGGALDALDAGHLRRTDTLTPF